MHFAFHDPSGRCLVVEFVGGINRRLYFRTYENLSIQVVDISRLDLGGDSIKTILLDRPEVFEDVT